MHSLCMALGFIFGWHDSLKLLVIQNRKPLDLPIPGSLFARNFLLETMLVHLLIFQPMRTQSDSVPIAFRYGIF